MEMSQSLQFVFLFLKMLYLVRNLRNVRVINILFVFITLVFGGQLSAQKSFRGAANTTPCGARYPQRE
jgi:hypothetical protein